MIRRVIGVFLAGMAIVPVASTARAQVSVPTPPAVYPNLLDSHAIISATMKSAVVNNPYQAERTIRNVQKLADGTVITVETHGTVARSSSGQIREDLINDRSSEVEVGDPAAHLLTTWRTGGSIRTATVMRVPPAVLRLPASGSETSGGQGSAITLAPTTSAGPPRVNAPAAPNLLNNLTQAASVKSADANPNIVTHEDLGQQSIEGLLVTGTRTTTVIPLGKIGNDRPITLTEEVWTSPELGIIVKQIDNDPRTGERTMELTGITKAEPDAALFHPPADYQVQDEADAVKQFSALGTGPNAVPETK